MGHRCGGPNCYRTRGLRSQCPSCNRSRENHRKTVVGGGKVRRISQHMLGDLQNNRHSEITRERVAYVLDNWVVRGVYTNPQGDSRVHYAFVPDLGKVVRVAVSMDDKEIITAFPDTRATKKWQKGELTFFANKLAKLEVR